MAKNTYGTTRAKRVAWYNRPAVKVIWKIFGIFMKCLLTILLVFFLTGVLVAGIMYLYINSATRSIDVPELIKAGDGATTSTLYVVDNPENYALVKGSDGTYSYNVDSANWKVLTNIEGTRHTWVDLDDIPVNLQNAVIAIEDERFRQHGGVDWKRTGSAVVNLAFKFSSVEYGGSTITQQLVKQLTGDNDHTVMRKVTEIMKALEMENHYTKDEILENYLNILPLSDNITGVGFGAKYYFGTDVQDLSLAQCAAIASITQNPSFYDPYRHPENLRDRQQTVLKKMLECGFISQAEYDQAMGEELILFSSESSGDLYDYYTDMVIERVIADLQEQYGYSYAKAESDVYFGGLRIYSWENVAMQEKMEALYADAPEMVRKMKEYCPSNFYPNNDEYVDSIYPQTIAGDEEDPRVAFFATDYNGRVVVTVGDRGEKTGDRVTNISTMSMRQPGSSIKPIAVYAPGIQTNNFTYSSIVPDAPPYTIDGRPWPPNYGFSTAFNNGNTNLYLGLQKSLNTVATQVLKTVGLDYSYDFITTKLHISTYGEEDRNPSALGLGGCTYGVYLSELTSAYQIFGNGGYYNGFHCYDRVEKADGTVLLQSKPLRIPAIDPDTSYVMNRLLQQVIRGANGTLYNQVDRYWPDEMEIFAKTGTTDANNDVLAIGGTPYYVAGCWFGYRYNNEMTYTQAQAVKHLWNYGMLLLHEGKENANFDEFKADTEEHVFCRKSGMLASSGCTDTALGVYRPSNVPGVCTSCGAAPKPTTAPTNDTPNTEPTESSLPLEEPTEPAVEPTEPAVEPTEPPVVEPTEPPVVDPNGGETPLDQPE